MWSLLPVLKSDFRCFTLCLFLILLAQFGLLSGHHFRDSCPLGWPYVLIVFCLFVIFFICNFGFKSGIWLLIAPVPFILMSNENATPFRCVWLRLIKSCAEMRYVYLYSTTKATFLHKKFNSNDSANIRRNVSLQITLIAFWRKQNMPEISYKCLLLVNRSTDISPQI